MRVVIGAGGTAGHVFPALAVAERFRHRLGADVVFVGRDVGPEAQLVPAAGFRMVTVEALPFRRKVSAGMLQAPFAALRAAGRAREAVRGAHVVLGMGGYVSVPVSLAARRESVPLALHEQNAVPGLANRLAARWAQAVAVSFPATARRFGRRTPTVVTGNPVRASVLRVRDERERVAAEGREVLGIEAGRRTVVVFGGSQGALRLNRAAIDLCSILSDRRDLQLLLLTGTRHHDDIRRRVPDTAGLLVRTVSFLDRMELAYAVADLAVARSGASTVAELTVSGVPAILVPFPYATARHQEANALAVVRAGGAELVVDHEADGATLASRIRAIVDRPDRLAGMAEGARAFGRPDAADAVADLAASVAAGAA